MEEVRKRGRPGRKDGEAGACVPSSFPAIADGGGVPSASMEQEVADLQSSLEVIATPEDHGLAERMARGLMKGTGLVDHIRGIRVESMDVLQGQMIDRMQMMMRALTPLSIASMPADKVAASVRNLATALGVVVDKQRLEEGKSTSNIQSLFRDLTSEALRASGVRMEGRVVEVQPSELTAAPAEAGHGR